MESQVKKLRGQGILKVTGIVMIIKSVKLITALL